MASVTRKWTFGHHKYCRPRSAPSLYKNSYTRSNCLPSKKYMCHWCDECKKVQTLNRRCISDAAAGLGLHFLQMSKGPYSHDTGHIL